jgi:hypothetical protein
MKADKKEKKNKERRKQNGTETQTDRTRFKKGWGRLYVMTENNVVRPENQKKTKKNIFCSAFARDQFENQFFHN